MAFQRGEDSEQAQLGAIMQAEYQASVIQWGKNWHKMHSTKPKPGRRRR